MDYTHALERVFSKGRYQKVLVLLLLVFIPLFTITSGFFILPIMEFNPIADPIRVALTMAISILMAVNGTIMLHNYEQRKTTAKNTTALGGVIALFTTSCPVCQPIWLLWLGLGSASAFLADISVYIALLSLSLLIVSLHYSLKSSSDVCEVEKWKK